MTHIINKDLPPPQKSGRIRRALPALGLIAAAISGYTSQTSGAGTEMAAPEQLPTAVTAPMIAQEATLLHFARAQGIGDAVRETGVPFPDQMNQKLSEVRQIVETGRTEGSAYRIDMAYSSGYLDALEGGWGISRLDQYVDAIFQTEKGILELADQATIRWSDDLGPEGGRELILGAMALTVVQDPYEVIWSGSITGDPQRMAASMEVSGAVRLLLDEMHEAAYVPEPVTGLTGVQAGIPDSFEDVPTTSTCTLEI
jgi:hypothetical protein